MVGADKSTRSQLFTKAVLFRYSSKMVFRSSGCALPKRLTRKIRVKPKIGRPLYGKGRASWYDRHKAARVFEEVTGGQGPASVLGSLYQNKSEAKAAAGANKSDLDRKKGGGSFTIVGNPFVVAETIVVASGCRAGVDGEWLARSVEHSYSDAGYVTKIEVETPNKK